MSTDNKKTVGKIQTLNGFIKIYRSITDWEWYDDVNTYRLFTHLLYTVNWKDSRWHNLEVKRGQRVLSVSQLASETNLTVKNVRTALDHLISSGEVAKQVANGVTLVTVENYDKYQCLDVEDGKLTGKEVANDWQTGGKEVANDWQTGGKEVANDWQAINEEGKNSKNNNNIKNKELKEIQELKKEGSGETPRRFAPPTLAEVAAYCLERGNQVNPQRFIDFYEAKGWMIGKSKMKDWRAAVRTWEQRDRPEKNKNSFVDIFEEEWDGS